MTETEHPIIRSSTPVRVFENSRDVTAIEAFPNGRRMVVNSSDGLLRMWDLKDGLMFKELGPARGGAIQDIVLSRDGKLIVSSDPEGYITVWDGDTGKHLTQAFKPFSSAVYSLDISPDGATLATAGYYSYGMMIMLWTTATWQLQGEPIKFYYDQLNQVRYSPSSELLAVATDNNLQIWNPAQRECIVSLVRPFATSLVWTPDGTHLLSSDSETIQVWDSSTWRRVSNIWKTPFNDYPCHVRATAVNCSGTVVAFPTTNNRVRLLRLSDSRTIAVFQHSHFPSCITFSIDGKHVLAGGNDHKISLWAVPEHAWPTDTPEGQFSANDGEDFDTKIIATSTTIRNACRIGDLPTAEELLTQKINANGNDYLSYASRSVVLARNSEWDRALNDATKSLSIQPSWMGYISKGIALYRKKQVWDANQAFDLSFTFADANSKIIFMIKVITLFNVNQHAEAMRRVQELASACPDADTVTTLACRAMEVYLHIQLGNDALDRARPSEAAEHFTTAVNTGTFLSKAVIDSKYEDLLMLFGCDLSSLWQTANQKLCHSLLRAGKLAEVFKAYKYMADMSDEATKASCLDWSTGFMQELSEYRGHALSADATLDMCKYDENDSISDIDCLSDAVASLYE